MEKISRKGFLKIAAAAAMGSVTAGALAACQAASSGASSAASGAGSVAAGATYIPGTYEGTAEGISSTVKVTMTFSENAVIDVVVDTSGETASYGAAAAEELQKQLLAAGSAEIDGVSGSTVTSEAVMKAAKSCFAQAMGETVVTSVQLPTGDENDWLGTEPDIDEASITETWDTDIVIVGAGNGGMCAAAFAAQNGLNFRIIEQNSAVMETRHWYGTIDSSEAKKQGVEPVDRAELLSEISRSMGGPLRSAGGQDLDRRVRRHARLCGRHPGERSLQLHLQPDPGRRGQVARRHPGQPDQADVPGPAGGLQQRRKAPQPGVPGVRRE